MKKTINQFVIIVLVAIIGFSITACKDSGDSSPNFLDEFDLTKGIPPNALLNNVGLADESLNSIATGAGYLGYEYDADDLSLFLLFTGKTKADYYSMKTLLATTTGGTLTNEDTDDDEFWEARWEYNTDYVCNLEILLADYKRDDGVIIPKGTMWITLWYHG